MKLIFILLVTLVVGLQRVTKETLTDLKSSQEYVLILFCADGLPKCDEYAKALEGSTYSSTRVVNAYYAADNEEQLKEVVSEYPLLSLENQNIQSSNYYEDSEISSAHVDAFLRRLLEEKAILISDISEITAVEGMSVTFSGNRALFEENEEVLLLSAKAFTWNVFYQETEAEELTFIVVHHRERDNERLIRNPTVIPTNMINFEDVTDIMFFDTNRPYSTVSDRDFNTYLSHRIPMLVMLYNTPDAELYEATHKLSWKDNSDLVYFNSTTISEVYQPIAKAFNVREENLPCAVVMREFNGLYFKKYRKCSIKPEEVEDFVEKTKTGEAERVMVSNKIALKEGVIELSAVADVLEQQTKDVLLVHIHQKENKFKSALNMIGFLKSLLNETIEIVTFTTEFNEYDGSLMKTPEYSLVPKSDLKGVEKFEQRKIFNGTLMPSEILKFIGENGTTELPIINYDDPRFHAIGDFFSVSDLKLDNKYPDGDLSVNLDIVGTFEEAKRLKLINLKEVNEYEGLGLYQYERFIKPSVLFKEGKDEL